MIQKDDRIRFVADSRNGDWKKGDVGSVDRVLALPPQNQSSLYVVTLGESKVWATDRDIEATRQMTIFDVLPTDDAA